MERTYFHAVRCYASYLPNASQPESILPYSALLRGPGLCTLHFPGPAGFLLDSSNERHSRKVGRPGEGRRAWVPVFSFPACTAPAAAVGSSLHFLSAPPNPDSSRYRQQRVAFLLARFEHTDPCSGCLGFKWAPIFSFAPLALRLYLLPAVTISESVASVFPFCSISIPTSM